MDSRARRIRLFSCVCAASLLLLASCSLPGCFMSRESVKLDYLSFSLDRGFEWQAGMTADIDFIGIFDEELTTPYAVIGILGPFEDNEIYQIIPIGAETITIGDKEVLTFPMPGTLQSILGIAEAYTMYVYNKGDSGVAVFCRNEETYIEETKKIIESLDIRT